ncbi:MAG: thiamine diphosphokinase [Oscillospiraceae bacterium]|nr:thiamine diphosphokinase [Oscillospiraceae bacterium]
MKICHIIGAVPVDVEINPHEGDLIIAADGGLDSLKKTGIGPHVFLGDMDSVTDPDLPDSVDVVKHPVEKDDTDTALAIEYASIRGFDNFILYGCIGGALDHTLGNMSLLKGMAEKGKTAVFVDGKYGITAFSKRRLEFLKDAHGRVSVFSLSDSCVGVDICGFKYETDKVLLSSTVTLGVGNEFVGKEASVCASSGTIAVYTEVENLLRYSNLFDKKIV